MRWVVFFAAGAFLATAFFLTGASAAGAFAAAAFLTGAVSLPLHRMEDPRLGFHHGYLRSNGARRDAEGAER